MAGVVQEDVKKTGLSRRAFIQGSALVAASLALQGCSNTNMQTTTETDPITEGEWISAACWSHCGGKCLLKAYVVDGIVMRLKSDDTHEDSPGNMLRKACARGRSRRMDLYGPTRLKYPMKRKSWKPGGGENSQGHLRGLDEWQRISWEEALDTIAEEITRIVDTYGNRALLGSTGGTPNWKEGSFRTDEALYSGAMYIAENETVQHDDDLCIGCQNCMNKCPYDVPQWLADKEITAKCDMCIHLWSSDEQPACIEACPQRVLEWGSFEELRARHPEAVIDLPILPDSSQTGPSTLIAPRAVALDPDFCQKII
ncbi:MAG: molybdopterin-dependent oxidoreductase [Coriobacteriales bacterium]|jgi:predicted molibdopterin-dependent oxidoreductase YjgC|nr:molybdopterin-dependent oxidoreductase [Coriobacteriales bacterium]